ncbi:hypothetical protein Cgig2_006430 [Carnegiea gigantea]|uniref:Uncharacterized protein n=1 Tax=Carnegiea gigantea TaxID=171969 RepID=A0A9Q1GJ85_9CARY|nr:hypothetical protein Cgig2_006430 [Carnegiea gigantea]
MATVLWHPGLLSFMVRCRNPTVQRHSLLVTLAALNGRRWLKLHQLRVLTLGLSLVAVLHVLNPSRRLEVQVSLGAPKRTQCSRHAHDDIPNPRPWSTFQRQPLLWSGLSPVGTASLSSRPPRPPSPSLASPSSISGSDGANDQDLANSSTKARLAEESPPKNSAVEARVFNEGSLGPAGSWRPPYLVRGRAVSRSLMLDTPLDPFVFQGWGPGPQTCASKCHSRVLPVFDPRSLAGTQVRAVQ